MKRCVAQDVAPPVAITTPSREPKQTNENLVYTGHFLFSNQINVEIEEFSTFPILLNLSMLSL